MLVLMLSHLGEVGGVVLEVEVVQTGGGFRGRGDRGGFRGRGRSDRGGFGGRGRGRRDFNSGSDSAWGNNDCGGMMEEWHQKLHNNTSPDDVVICQVLVTVVLENLALSSNDNENLIYCLKGWHHALNLFRSNNDEWAIYAKSVLDRTRLALAGKAEWYQQILQPSAEYLGSLLAVDEWAVNMFTEEIIRGGSAAALSSLINRLDPVLRKTAHLGSWQVISPVEAVGYVVVVDELLTVQNKSYDRPTILVAKRVKGEEEIPDGAVAVLTPILASEDAQCTVCLAEYSGEDMLRILPYCGHSFHVTCIDLWLQQHSTCPVCRISLREFPDRKRMMQPLFSSALRTQYGMESCENGLVSRARDSLGVDPIQENHCITDGNEVEGGENVSSLTVDDTVKDSGKKRVESPSNP